MSTEQRIHFAKHLGGPIRNRRCGSCTRSNLEEKLALIEKRATSVKGAIEPDELKELRLLVNLRLEMPSNFRPRPQLIYTDIRRDPDDQGAFLLMILLHKFKFIEIAGVVSTSPPTVDRARFVKAMLEEHGLEKVEVVAGIQHETDKTRAGQFECIKGKNFALSRLDSATFARRLLRKRKSVDIICISPTVDVADLFNRYPRCHKHIRRFTFQSDVTIDGDQLQPAKQQNYNADGANEPALKAATETVLTYLSRHTKIETLFVPKTAGAKAQVRGFQYYKDLKTIGEAFPTTYRSTPELYDQQEEAFVELLTDIKFHLKGNLRWQPFGDKTFGIKEDLPDKDLPLPVERAVVEARMRSMLPKVKTFILYDPVAALLSVEPITKNFDGTGLLQQGVKLNNRHLLLSGDEIEGDVVRSLMQACIKGSAILGSN